MSAALAHAKINLALVVGPLREDGKHELATVFQRVALADRISIKLARPIEPAGATEPDLAVEGFPGDTLVRAALAALTRKAGVGPRWRITIEKEVPVAAGLGGGSSDAARSLRLANAELPRPLPDSDLLEIARAIGADVAFFLAEGPQLGTGDGSELRALDLPQDYAVVIVLPAGVVKPSTASVYAAFDERGGTRGFDSRRSALDSTLARIHRRTDLALLPPNDLASSPLSDRLLALGAFRADVSGAGPAVFGLFEGRREAETAAREIEASPGVGRVWITEPAW